MEWNELGIFMTIYFKIELNVTKLNSPHESLSKVNLTQHTEIGWVGHYQKIDYNVR